MDETGPAYGPLRQFVLKSAVLLMGLLCLTYLPYLVLGLWNRLFGGWRSVFFCYAGSRNYVDTYAPPLVAAAFRWRPSPIGVLWQGGAWGIVLASPVTEADFLDPANGPAFDRLQRRIARIAWLVDASEVNLAGILPGVLRGHSALPVPDGRPVVVAAVLAGAAEVVARRFAGRWPPVIVLGGAGYIGTPLSEALAEKGRDVHIVDPRGGDMALPDLLGAPALLIDVARKGVLAGYTPQVWPGLVVLNETFPRPARRDIAALTAAGAEIWHLSGLQGRVIPPLPFGYEDAVPCCAAHVPGDPPQVRVIPLAAPITAL